MALYHQDDTDKSYFERVAEPVGCFVSAGVRPGPVEKDLARPGVVIAPKEPITLGFDGARWRDACGFIATHIETGLQWLVAVWERLGKRTGKLPTRRDGRWKSHGYLEGDPL